MANSLGLVRVLGMTLPDPPEAYQEYLEWLPAGRDLQTYTWSATPACQPGGAVTGALEAGGFVEAFCLIVLEWHRSPDRDKFYDAVVVSPEYTALILVPGMRWSVFDNADVKFFESMSEEAREQRRKRLSKCR